MNPAESDDIRPFRQSSSPSTKEYQAKLLDKLTALVGVIDIAIARVRASMAKRQGDPVRLQEILDNLTNTRAICLRARTVLQKRLGMDEEKKPAAAPRPKAPRGEGEEGNPSYREYVEFSSSDEMNKFKDLGKISKEEVNNCDVDDLLRKLTEGDGL